MLDTSQNVHLAESSFLAFLHVLQGLNCPRRLYFKVDKNGYLTSLAGIRTCGPDGMATLIELYSHMPSQAILIGPQVL